MKLDQEKHPENWKEDKREYGRFPASRRVPWPGYVILLERYGVNQTRNRKNFSS